MDALFFRYFPPVAAQLINELLEKDKLELELNITDKHILQKLKPGDHICSGRKNDTYYHHGIYLGKNRVIHFQGPHKVNDQSVVCKECGYKPNREGTVVKTCLDCFCVGNLLCICEYGIRASEEDMENWVSENVNADGIIYTRRNGNLHLGIWTDDKTVIHLSRGYYNWVGSAPCPKCRFKLKNNLFLRKTNGAMVETCLECFLGGGFLYANEHRLCVTGTFTDSWIPYSNEIDHGIHDCLSDELQLLDSDFFGNFIRMPTFLTKAVADATQTAQSSLKKLTHLRCKPYFLYEVLEDCFSKIMGSSDIILVYKSNQIRVYQQHSIKPADKVVADANEYLKNQFGIYDILRNNCEHFAFMCKTGVPTSIQVNTFPDELITSLIRFAHLNFHSSEYTYLLYQISWLQCMFMNLDRRMSNSSGTKM